ncbi:hypothetical protein [Nocardioides sp. T2.26MG-1]|uniref:hypothetical protein n=1 Tax=Nocardioides sp. T2.26MG-1 TaxID=3041166 RepID=UPI00254037F3|nr:hypothetical protein [Nocardioides sp. T2.26MG-1]
MSHDGEGPTDAGDAGRGSEPEVGSVAEEAARLLGALSEWARDQGSGIGEGVAGLAGQAARAAHDVDEHLATGAAECTYCPICRTVHVLRQTTPEVRAQLTTAATALMQAAAAMLATTVPDDRGARGGPGGVERIDLDDDPGAWPEDPDDPVDPGGPEDGDR